MSAFEYSKNWMVTANQREYQSNYDHIHFETEANYKILEKKREEQRQKLLDLGAVSCNADAKLYSSELSPGCRLCSEGKWSCLFINGVCNANCFYCPSPQDDVSVPGTNLLQFKNAADYVNYLAHF
ncbi:MAG TPA: radical SAM protein, partial [Candidatus Cloacimonadota bacterium]|nr:radical SAM protein [Candidatus Cloacimonadota bacterium]